MKFIFLHFYLFMVVFITSCSSTLENRERSRLLLERGVSFYQNGNYPLALRDLLQAEEYDATNPIVQNNLGLIYFEREKYDLAEIHLRKAIKLLPTYTDAKNNLGRILIELKRYVEADKILSEVVHDLTYNNQEKGFFNLGLSKFNQGNYEEARQAFLKSLDLQRENCPSYSYLGRTYFEAKNYLGAAETLDKAIGFCQRLLFDEPHYFSALTYFRLGDKERAKARFEELIKLYPNGKYREKSKAMLDILRKVN